MQNSQTLRRLRLRAGRRRVGAAAGCRSPPAACRSESERRDRTAACSSCPSALACLLTRCLLAQPRLAGGAPRRPPRPCGCARPLARSRVKSAAAAAAIAGSGVAVGVARGRRRRGRVADGRRGRARRRGLLLRGRGRRARSRTHPAAPCSPARRAPMPDRAAYSATSRTGCTRERRERGAGRAVAPARRPACGRGAPRTRLIGEPHSSSGSSAVGAPELRVGVARPRWRARPSPSPRRWRRRTRSPASRRAAAASARPVAAAAEGVVSGGPVARWACRAMPGGRCRSRAPAGPAARPRLPSRGRRRRPRPTRRPPRRGRASARRWAAHAPRARRGASERGGGELGARHSSHASRASRTLGGGFALPAEIVLPRVRVRPGGDGRRAAPSCGRRGGWRRPRRAWTQGARASWSAERRRPAGLPALEARDHDQRDPDDGDKQNYDFHFVFPHSASSTGVRLAPVQDPSVYCGRRARSGGRAFRQLSVHPRRPINPTPSRPERTAASAAGAGDRRLRTETRAAGRRGRAHRRRSRTARPPSRPGCCSRR